MGEKVTYNWLFLCLLLLCAGNASGWAIARNIAGSDEGAAFFYFGLTFSSIIFLVQALIFARARKRLVFHLIFRAASGLSLLWYMLCLAFPIFWMPVVDIYSKIALAAFSVLLFACNGREGVRTFERRWCEKTPAVNKYYDLRRKSLDWNKIVNSLHLSVSLYIPGVSPRIIPLLSVFLILSMMLGLNFRRMYPSLSVFAWGIPCIILSSTLIQMMAMNIAQALKVVELEAEMGAKIRPINA
jgi:hypothetical protein